VDHSEILPSMSALISSVVKRRIDDSETFLRHRVAMHGQDVFGCNAWSGCFYLHIHVGGLQFDV